jgi:hypothetical protein
VDTFTDIIGSFALVISVFIGFYLGDVVSQVDRVGQAALVIQVNNATTEVGSWVTQANDLTTEFPLQTLLYAILLVLVFVLLKPRLDFHKNSRVITPVLFPVLVAISWIVLPVATLPASVPQPFLSISISGFSKDVNLSVEQIFTFITFYRSFVLALKTLTVITAFGIFTLFIGWSRKVFRNVPFIIGPIVSWFVIDSFQIPGIIIAPGPTSNVTISGGGCIGCLPPLLLTLSMVVIEIAFVIWAVSALEFLTTRDSREQLAEFRIRLRKIL